MRPTSNKKKLNKQNVLTMSPLGFALAACAPCDDTSTPTNTININASAITKIGDIITDPDLAPTFITGAPGSINIVAISGDSEPVRAIIENIEIVSVADIAGEVELVIAEGDLGIKTIKILSTDQGNSYAGTLIVVGDKDAVNIDIGGSHGGTITSNGSRSIEVNFLNDIAATVTTDINAISANIINISAVGGSTIFRGVISAPIATDLVISADDDFTIKNPISGVISNINVVTGGKFKFLSPITDANTITVGGCTGSVHLDSLVSQNSDSLITLTAYCLPDGLIVGPIDAGDAGINAVMIDLTGMDKDGPIVMSTIHGDEAVTINAAGTVGDIQAGLITGGVITLNHTGGEGAVTGSSTLSVMNPVGEANSALGLVADSNATVLYGTTDANTGTVVTHGSQGELLVNITGTKNSDGLDIIANEDTSVINITGDFGEGADGILIDGGQPNNFSRTISISAENYDASVIIGGQHSDSITGGSGSDDIRGGAGNDLLVGGIGADLLMGDAGEDVFVFLTTDSGITTETADIISDYVSGTDSIQLITAGTMENFFVFEAEPALGDDLHTVEEAVEIANNASGVGTSFDGTIQYMYLINSLFEGDSYLVADNNFDGAADFAIQLSGLSTDEILFTDLIAY